MASNGYFSITGLCTVAMQFDGGVVFGSDSRTVAGGYVVSRYADKLTCITPNIYCCGTGILAHYQRITGRLSIYLKHYGSDNGKPVQVHRAACEFRNYCYEKRKKIGVTFIIGGWDEIRGGQVYEIFLGSMMMQRNYAISGPGGIYIKKYMEASYKPGMNEENSIKVVKKAIQLAIKSDIYSGGKVQIGVIDKDGFREHIVTEGSEDSDDEDWL